MPKNIKGIERTNSAKELAAIYTAADVFVNPSVEETFGMTTIEAKACGTKAVVYKGTACEEVINKHGGEAIPASADATYLTITGQKWGGAKRDALQKLFAYRARQIQRN